MTAETPSQMQIIAQERLLTQMMREQRDAAEARAEAAEAALQDKCNELLECVIEKTAAEARITLLEAEIPVVSLVQEQARWWEAEVRRLQATHSCDLCGIVVSGVISGCPRERCPQVIARFAAGSVPAADNTGKEQG